MNRHLIACALGVIRTIATPALGSPLIYTPVNPNFGGSPFSGQTLLNQAQWQNGFKEPAAAASYSNTPPTAAEKENTWRYAMRSARCLVIASAMIVPLMLPSIGSASQLLYTPINPVFGGNPQNGPYLLGLAGANNKFTQDPATKQQDGTVGTGQDAVQQFQQVVTSALLSQIAAQVGQEIIGPNAKDSGVFNLNGEVIQFNRAGGQVNISIKDGASGATTSIQIPVPQF